MSHFSFDFSENISCLVPVISHFCDSHVFYLHRACACGGKGRGNGVDHFRINKLGRFIILMFYLSKRFNCSNALVAHPASYTMGTRSSFPAGKAVGA